MPHPTLYEARLAPTMQTGATLTNQWVYLDADNLEAFRVLAYEGPGARSFIRTIWPAAPAEDAWRMDEPPGPWPLYRLPELPAFGRVYVCHSERSADALWWAGLAATTCAHGLLAVHKTDWSPLAAASVVIMPCNNEAGQAFALTVAAALDRLMPSALDVRVLEFPGLPPDGDVVDFLQARGSGAAAVRELEALAEQAPHWSESRALVPPVPSPAKERTTAGEGTGGTTLRSDSPMPPMDAAAMEWLWPDRIACGHLCLLLGVASPGHGPVALDLAARVSTGAPWPDGAGHAPRGSVLLANFRDGTQDMIRQFLTSAGADMSRIASLGTIRHAPGRHPLAAIAALKRAIRRYAGITVEAASRRSHSAHPFEHTRQDAASTVNARRDAASTVEAASRRLHSATADTRRDAASTLDGGDVRLVLIDRAAQYLSGHAPEALAALQNLAAEAGVAIVMIQALPGTPRSLARLHSAAGPALRSARTALLAVPDPHEPGRQLLLPAHPDAKRPGLAYRLAGATIQWDATPAAGSADAALRARRKRPGPPPARQLAAEQWLRRRLAEGPAYVGSPRNLAPGSLRWEAKTAGMSWCTVRRAFRAGGAVAELCPETGRRRWRAT